MHSTRARLRTGAAVTTAAVTLVTALGTAAVADGVPATTETDAAPAAAPWTGTVGSWGLDGEFGAANVPQDLGEVVDLDAFVYMGTAVRADGTAVAWLEGYSDWDFAGWADGLTDVVELVPGGAHLLARHTDGSLSAIGWDAHGQSTIPADLDDVVALDAGSTHNLALRSDGTVVAWGEDRDGQATVPAGLDDVVAVAAGSLHSVALRADGTVVAWGSKNLVDVPDDLDDVVAVAAGSHTLALRADGTVVAWGSPLETWGGSTSVPIGLDSVVDIAVGGPFSFVVVESGAVSPLPDTTPPQIRDKGTITKAATSAKGARIWFTPEVVDDVFTDPHAYCSRDRGDWSRLGKTRVSCRAEDWAGNRSQKSYDVHVTWSWSGLRLPTRPDGLVQFDWQEPVPVSFKLTKGSHGASDAKATLWWAPVTDGAVGEYVQVRDPYTDETEFTFDGWKYEFWWPTEATPGPGTYSLKVDLGDGVDRTTLVDLI